VHVTVGHARAILLLRHVCYSSARFGGKKCQVFGMNHPEAACAPAGAGGVSMGRAMFLSFGVGFLWCWPLSSRAAIERPNVVRCSCVCYRGCEAGAPQLAGGPHAGESGAPSLKRPREAPGSTLPAAANGTPKSGTHTAWAAQTRVFAECSSPVIAAKVGAVMKECGGDGRRAAERVQ
jgi:hypothetical protein